MLAFIYKYILRREEVGIEADQPKYSEIRDKMAAWSLNSYDPSLNLKYRKILMAMLDVAEVNEPFGGDTGEKVNDLEGSGAADTKNNGAGHGRDNSGMSNDSKGHLK